MFASNDDYEPQEQVMNDREEEKHSDRYLILIALPLLGGVIGFLFLVNMFAGLCLGVALGLLIHGVKTKVTIKGDQFAVRKVYRRPQWLRWVVAVLFIVAAVALLTNTTWFNGVDWLSMNESNHSTLLSMILFVTAIYVGMFGRWKKFYSFLKNADAHRRAKTDDEKALLRFTSDTLRQAGLGLTSDVAREEILPTILSRETDDKGRAIVKIALIPGKQTFAEVARLEDRIATAWQIPRVVVRKSGPLDDGRHTAIIMAVLKDSLVPKEFYWEPLDANLPVAEYVSMFPIGAFTESGEDYSFSIREKNFVVGGGPGSGKSSFINALIAHLIRHPHTRVQYIDLKNGVESGVWEEGISDTIDNGPGGAGILGTIDFIEKARQDMAARYSRMREKGVTNVWTEGFIGEDEPVKFLIIDECSELFNTSTKEERENTRVLIEKIKSFVQQGRAAGYILLMATQNPTRDNLPPPIRNVLSDRIAFRLNENSAYATLGNSITWTSHNDPTTSKKGEAVIKTEEVDMERIKVRFLTNDLKKKVISESRITGKPWLDQVDEDSVEEDEEVKPSFKSLSKNKKPESHDNDEEDEEVKARIENSVYSQPPARTRYLEW